MVAASPWLYPVLYLLVVGDAFLVVLPSETFVVALGVLSAATGQPPLWAVIPVAAFGALTGDLLCFRIGRSVGLDRWRWQRSPRIARAIERARVGVHRRPAALILTARYIPFARIAVNLAAGATALPVRVFLPLAAVAGTAWAVYNSVIGAVVGRLVPNPVIAVAISVVVALVVGATVDAVGGRLSRRASARSTAALSTAASGTTAQNTAAQSAETAEASASGNAGQASETAYQAKRVGTDTVS
jgi:membrane protein DedA with SNARE-associated domain